MVKVILAIKLPLALAISVAIPAAPKVFDVTAFGAKGDGEHDDYASIQAAFDAAAAHAGTGTTVLFPRSKASSTDAGTATPPMLTYLVMHGLQLRSNHTTVVIDGKLTLPADPHKWSVSMLPPPRAHTL
jgi:polygalacturonase